jgi:hypothetical protein
MYYLASDELGGRLPGEEGYDAAARYAATQFRQAGLAPVCHDTDGRETYLQQVPIIKKTIAVENELRLKTNSEARSLSFGDEFFFTFPVESEKIDLSGSLVFAGYGIHEPQYGWDDYAGIDVRGKWVVYMFGDPKKDGNSVLPEELSKAYSDRMEGYYRKGLAAAEEGALGVVVIFNEESFRLWEIIRHATREECTLPDLDPLLPRLCVEVFLNKEPLKRLFQNRSFNPLSGEGEYSSFSMEDVTLSLETQIRAEDIQSYNVVGMVKGTDPEVNEEYITVGAHLDHVGEKDGVVFNGADDDASGCAAILEAAEAVALNPPRRSVIFVLYTGEEMGFMGSQHFVSNSPVPLKNIVVNINLDMVGRPDGDARELATMISYDLAPSLEDIMDSVNRRTTNLRLDHEFRKYFNMSDQVVYYRSGIPVVFFHTGDHADVHQATDDAEKIDYEFLKKSSELTYHLTLELANREERLGRTKNQ